MQRKTIWRRQDKMFERESNDDLCRAFQVKKRKDHQVTSSNQTKGSSGMELAGPEEFVWVMSEMRKEQACRITDLVEENISVIHLDTERLFGICLTYNTRKVD
jgi:hypothetical protein